MLKPPHHRSSWIAWAFVATRHASSPRRKFGPPVRKTPPPFHTLLPRFTGTFTALSTESSI
eukprot:5294955-Prorocentrum_lima.AAC.1